MTADERLVDQVLDELLERYDPRATDVTTFRGAQFDAGLAWVQAPAGCGGLGVPSALQHRVAARIRAAGFDQPERNFIGVHQAAAAVLAAGTPTQKARWLRPAFTYKEIWCQLFSEPGAGSDLAGLSTVAERDGDEWRVNGQKVWTSGAHESRWGFLVARTDGNVPKHRGLTCFVCDMQSEGIEVRPIRQMDGGVHFNEVFLSDVRIADEHRLGDVGDGWAVSLTGLHAEREGVGTSTELSFGVPGGTARLIELWHHSADRSSPRAEILRRRIIDALIAEKLLDLSSARLLDSGGTGAAALGSLSKIWRTRFAQESLDLCMDILGAEGMLGGEYDSDSSAGADRSLQLDFLRSPANSIEGGTSEIVMNIIGERILGLPGDVRVDKDVPWREVPRT